MKYNEDNRAFAAFSGSCPYNCLHCYTFSAEFVSKGKNNIDEILQDLSNKSFDIVYISGYKENFIDPYEGLNLLEAIYKKFSCDILLTTRTVFDLHNTERLFKLNYKMRQNNNRLYFCESIPAYESYKLLEPNPSIPSPQKRLDFLKRLYIGGIDTILTIRPLCPNDFIPITESIKLINEANGYCSAIISSGIVVDEYILKRLRCFPNDFEYEEKTIMSCLNNDMQVKYVNVNDELSKIAQLCRSLNIPFFNNSLPAINYLYLNT